MNKLNNKWHELKKSYLAGSDPDAEYIRFIYEEWFSFNDKLTEDHKPVISLQDFVAMVRFASEQEAMVTKIDLMQGIAQAIRGRGTDNS